MKKHIFTHYCRIFFIIFPILMAFSAVSAQTVTCTGTTVAYWSTTPGCIVFGVRNTNPGGIIITDMSNHMPASNTNSFSLWYHPTVTTGVPADVTTANGWILVTNGASITNVTAGVVPILSGINLTIPGNTTYRLALVGNVQSPYYTSSGAGGTVFTAGGVEVYAQGNSTSPTYVGYYPGPVNNTPRGFNGSITFISAVPTAPNCLASPIVPANASTTVCSGNTMLRWNKAAAATGYDVYLDPGTGSPTTIVSSNQADTFYNATTAVGPYRWKIVPRNTVGPATGCNVWSFTTLPGLTPSVSTIVSPDDTICLGASATFTATPVNGGPTPFYQWKKNNINVGGNSPVYTDGSLVDNDEIKVVMTSNANGCLTNPTPTSNAITMRVLPSPTTSLVAEGPVAFCNGGSVPLRTTVSGTSYEWKYNGMIIAGATSASYNATMHGYYKVRITTAGSLCPTNSDSVLVTVYPTPFPLVNRSGMILSTETTYDTYQWYFNGSPISGATSSTYTITRDGLYYVKVKDLSGCDGVSIVTPINSLTVATMNADDVVIYPNPVVNSLRVESAAPVNITIRSLEGKVLLKKGKTNTADISHIANGIYLLQVDDADGNFIKMQQLVKSGQ